MASRFWHRLWTWLDGLLSHLPAKNSAFDVGVGHRFRIARAVGAARRAGRMTPDDTARLVNDALARGDDSHAFRLILQARDDIRAERSASDQPRPTAASWLYAWDDREDTIRSIRYDTLLRVIVCHEFGDDAPQWSTGAQLDHDWVLPDPFRDPESVRAGTPAWLAAARIFIDVRGLETA